MFLEHGESVDLMLAFYRELIRINRKTNYNHGNIVFKYDENRQLLLYGACTLYTCVFILFQFTIGKKIYSINFFHHFTYNNNDDDDKTNNEQQLRFYFIRES